MPLNGITLSFWFIGLVICYGVAYLHGRSDEREKFTKDVKVLNDKIRELLRGGEMICPECGENRPGDERVKAGMKCGRCAYGC